MSEPKTKRIQRKRSKGWRMPKNTVYVGRPGDFGNPFDNVADFETWLKNRDSIALSALVLDHLLPWSPNSKLMLDIRHTTIMTRLPELKGKDLACFCPDGHACHADILLKKARAL